MGYTTRAYLVDLQKIGEATGSGDVALVKKIIASDPEAFDDDDIPDDLDSLPLSTALEQIITGKVTTDDATQYKYAFEQVCNYFGKLCLIGRYPIFEAGIDDFFDREFPVRFPTEEDFPDLGHVLRNEIADELERLESLSQSRLEDDIQELLSVYIPVLRKADKTQTDVVLFHG